MRLLLLVFSTFIIYSVNAQFPNWGWAPPISIDNNGSSITCTVTDPLTGQTKSTTKNSVQSYLYQEGVLVWVSSSLTHAMVYDQNAHDWKSASWYAPDNISINNGVVAMQSNSQTYVAIYDPNTREWEYTNRYATGNVLNDGGVVAFQSTDQTYAAFYDPYRKAWEVKNWYADGDMWLNQGVLAFQSSTQTYFAVYDLISRSWDWTARYAVGNVVNRNGVVAFQSTDQTYVAAYDPSDLDWAVHNYYELGALSIVDGTVFINNGGTMLKKGYNASSGSWVNNQNTSMVCRLFLSDTNDDSPLITHMYYMAIGASVNTYNCGDGHLINNAMAWKQFNSSGNYNITLNVSNSSINKNCNSSVTVTGGTVGINDVDEHTMTVYPNPTTGLFVIEGLEYGTQQVQLYNSLGELVLSGEYASGQAIDISDQPAGIYYLRVNGSLGVESHKAVKQ